MRLSTRAPQRVACWRYVTRIIGIILEPLLFIIIIFVFDAGVDAALDFGSVLRIATGVPDGYLLLYS